MKTYARMFASLTVAFTISTICSFSLASADTTYDAKKFASLNAAVTSIGHLRGILLITDGSKLAQSLTVPANITLRFQAGGVLTVGKGQKLTVESPIEAPPERIFTNDGTIVLKNAEVLPQWWGAKGNATNDDAYPIQAAIDSAYAAGGGTVRLSAGTYLLNHVTGAYYVLKSRDRVSVVGEGEKTILKLGNGLRDEKHGAAILYNHEDLVSNCRYAHFTVDYNGRANLRLASWGGKKVSDVSRLGAEHASDMVIEYLKFKDVTGAHCVYFGSHPSNQRNVVRNCTFSNVGDSVPGNHITDHSSIYIGGSHGLVADNVFINDTPCNVSTAIDMHCSDTLITRNRAVNYNTGMNIAAEINNCQRVKVTENTFKNCRYGIVFWHYDPFALSDCTITNCTISIRESDNTPFPPTQGIIHGGGYITSSVNMEGLTISANTIYQESMNSGCSHPNNGIYIESVNKLTIENNRIHNLCGEAIFIASRSKTQGMKDVVIKDNEIRNVGVTSNQARKRAIALNAYPDNDGAISNVFILDNTISRGDSTYLYGITFNSGHFFTARVTGNRINGTASADIVQGAARDGSFIVKHNGKVIR